MNPTYFAHKKAQIQCDQAQMSEGVAGLFTDLNKPHSEGGGRWMITHRLEQTAELGAPATGNTCAKANDHCWPVKPQAFWHSILHIAKVNFIDKQTPPFLNCFWTKPLKILPACALYIPKHNSTNLKIDRLSFCPKLPWKHEIWKKLPSLLSIFRCMGKFEATAAEVKPLPVATS